ncbi:hypothetical protein HDC92_000267 [Pedobacter sp. AK017]|uniref:hypothetical protein n=1 Tax=Pedobacter sp. AK017 TaxID=2723073 RepID=UPI00160CB7C1|nr:hypothetical protein [Pedobacter sp. AK017]MBB5436603.1 hypothetical protein [Pedobacter sp. AK017]
MERTQKKWILFKHLKTSTKLFTYLRVGEVMLNLKKTIMTASKTIFRTPIETFPEEVRLTYFTGTYKLTFPLSYIVLKIFGPLSGIATSFFSKKNNSTLLTNKITILQHRNIYDHDNEQRSIKIHSLNKMNKLNGLNYSTLAKIIKSTIEQCSIGLRKINILNKELELKAIEYSTTFKEDNYYSKTLKKND